MTFMRLNQDSELAKLASSHISCLELINRNLWTFPRPFAGVPVFPVTCSGYVGAIVYMLGAMCSDSAPNFLSVVNLTHLALVATWCQDGLECSWVLLEVSPSFVCNLLEGLLSGKQIVL